MPDGSNFESLYREQAEKNQPDFLEYDPDGKTTVNLESVEGLRFFTSEAENVYADAASFEAAAMADGYEQLWKTGRFTEVEAPEVFEQMYQKLETLQQLIDTLQYEVEVEKNGASDADVDAMQSLYNELTEYRDKITAAYTEETADVFDVEPEVSLVEPELTSQIATEAKLEAEAQAWQQAKNQAEAEDVPVSDVVLHVPEPTEVAAEVGAKEREMVEVWSKNELHALHEQLAQLDTEVTRVAGELVFSNTLEATTDATVIEVYRTKLGELKAGIAAYEDKLDVVLEADEFGVLSEENVGVQMKESAEFLKSGEQLVSDISLALEAVRHEQKQESEPEQKPEPLVLDASLRVETEPADTNVETSSDRLQTLKDEVFAKVDRVPHRTHVERAAAHQLLAQYESVSAEEQEQVATQLEQFLELVGKNTPESDRLQVEVDSVMTQFEDAYLSDPKFMADAVLMHEQIEKLIAARPTESNPVDQLIAEKNWQQEIVVALDNFKKLTPQEPSKSEHVEGSDSGQQEQPQSENDAEKSLQVFGMNIPRTGAVAIYGARSFREALKIQRFTFSGNPEKQILVDQMIGVLQSVPDQGISEQQHSQLVELALKLEMAEAINPTVRTRRTFSFNEGEEVEQVLPITVNDSARKAGEPNAPLKRVKDPTQEAGTPKEVQTSTIEQAAQPNDSTTEAALNNWDQMEAAFAELDTYAPTQESVEPANKIPLQDIQPPDRQVSVASSADSAAPESRVSRRRLTAEEQQQKNIATEINTIELKSVDRLAKFFGEKLVSPYEQMGKVPFGEFLRIANLPKSQIQKELLKYKLTDGQDELEINYNVFDGWVKRIDEIEDLVPDADRRTFKEVVDQYIKTLQSRYS